MSDSEHEFNTSEQCKSSSKIRITCRALYLVSVGTIGEHVLKDRTAGCVETSVETGVESVALIA